MVEPSIQVLLDSALDLALIHRLNILALQRSSILTCLKHAAVVHSLLQTVVLPAKEVISVGTVAFVVIVRKEERIGAILGPHVVELRSIPQRLVGDLWHADWVRRWACTCGTEGFFGCVVHVILVVGRVDILAVPA